MKEMMTMKNETNSVTAEKTEKRSLPKVEGLPIRFTLDSDSNGEHRQVMDCFRAYLMEVGPQLLERSPRGKPEEGGTFLEEGRFLRRGETARYETDHSRLIPAWSAFPLNLIQGSFGSYLVYHTQLRNLYDGIEKILEDLDQRDLLLLRARYALGLQNREILELLGLPGWDSFYEVLEEDMRFAQAHVRAPHRARVIDSYICPANQRNPLHLETYEAHLQYRAYFQELTEELQQALAGGENLTSALSRRYPQSVVDALMPRVGQWQKLPELPQNKLKLSWKTDYVLSENLDRIHVLGLDRRRLDLQLYWRLQEKLEERGIQSLGAFRALTAEELQILYDLEPKDIQVICGELEMPRRSMEAGAYTLEELWTVHGRERSLEDIDHSGLRRLTCLGDEECLEILTLIQERLTGDMDPEKAGWILACAEALMRKNGGESKGCLRRPGSSRPSPGPYPR